MLSGNFNTILKSQFLSNMCSQGTHTGKNLLGNSRQQIKEKQTNETQPQSSSNQNKI